VGLKIKVLHMNNLGVYVANQILDTSSKSVVTMTKESAFPSELRLKRSKIQTIERGDRMNEATIEQTCPECGRKEMRYYTVQLRSADEGSTVFYNCECGYKYAQCAIKGIP
jgi:DNA-directed RNA polymerase I subunit RPA12